MLSMNTLQHEREYVMCARNGCLAFLGHFNSYKLSFVVYSALNIKLAFWFLSAVITAIQTHLNAKCCRN